MKIKLLSDKAMIPYRGSEEAAGYDLYSIDSVNINPGECKLISTGIAIQLPTGYFGAIFPRSGTAVKRGLRLANCVAVIDSDYRGEIIVALHNHSNSPYVTKPGERIAQLIFIPYLAIELVETENLSLTERGQKGFGSTGK